MSLAQYGSRFTEDTGPEKSNNLWKDCPVDEIRAGRAVNGKRGVFIDDDFLDFPFIGTQTTEIAHGRWKVFNTGAGTVVPALTINSVIKPGGWLGIALDTDNDSGAVAQSYASYYMSGSANTSGKLWFEARLTFSPILTNATSWILGLAETNLWTLATGVPFNGSDALTNAASFVGFNKLEDGLGVINSCYSDRAAQAPTNIQASVDSVAAFEIVKLGMKYDPDDTAGAIRFYVNGVETSTPMTLAALTALTNLDSKLLGIIFACVADSAGTTSVHYLDWIKCYQLLPI